MPYQDPGWVTQTYQPDPTQPSTENGRNFFPNFPNMDGLNQLMNFTNGMWPGNSGNATGNNGPDLNNLFGMAKNMGFMPNNMMNPFGGNLFGNGLGGPLQMLSLLNGGMGSGSPLGRLLGLGRFFF